MGSDGEGDTEAVRAPGLFDLGCPAPRDGDRVVLGTLDEQPEATLEARCDLPYLLRVHEEVPVHPQKPLVSQPFL